MEDHIASGAMIDCLGVAYVRCSCSLLVAAFLIFRVTSYASELFGYRVAQLMYFYYYNPQSLVTFPVFVFPYYDHKRLGENNASQFIS